MPEKTLSDTFAVSLDYDGGAAPRVSAKGSGHLAQQIIDLAKQHNIPIKQDPNLTELLSQVEIDQQIPAVLYEAVVQVLIFAYQVSGKTPPTANSA